MRNKNTGTKPSKEATRSTMTAKRPGSNPMQHKPLRGRRLFLDLKDFRGLKNFENDLKFLGAKVEKCFSREVDIVITHKGQPSTYETKNKKKHAHSTNSPATPSPFNITGYRSLESPLADSPGVGDIGTKPITRGQAMTKAANLTKTYGSTDVVSTAQRLRIKVIHVAAAQAYVKREMVKFPESVKEVHPSTSRASSKMKDIRVKRLRPPFIKFESTTLQYRPIRSELLTVPRIYADSLPGSCPFEAAKNKGKGSGYAQERAEAEERDPVRNNSGSDSGSHREDFGAKTNQKAIGKRVSGGKISTNAINYRECNIMTAGELRRIIKEKKQAERKRGYCELCEVRYDNIDKHVRSDQHRKFVNNADNYKALDAMIAQGPNMEQFLADVMIYQPLDARLSQCQEEELPLEDVMHQASYISPIRDPKREPKDTKIKPKRSKAAQKLTYSPPKGKEGDMRTTRSRSVATPTKKHLSEDLVKEDLVCRRTRNQPSPTSPRENCAVTPSRRTRNIAAVVESQLCEPCAALLSSPAKNTRQVKKGQSPGRSSQKKLLLAGAKGDNKSVPSFTKASPGVKRLASDKEDSPAKVFRRCGSRTYSKECSIPSKSPCKHSHNVSNELPMPLPEKRTRLCLEVQPKENPSICQKNPLSPKSGTSASKIATGNYIGTRSSAGAGADLSLKVSEPSPSKNLRRKEDCRTNSSSNRIVISNTLSPKRCRTSNERSNRSPKSGTLGIVHKSPRKRMQGSAGGDIVKGVKRQRGRASGLGTKVSTSPTCSPKPRLGLGENLGGVVMSKTQHQKEVPMTKIDTSPQCSPKPRLCKGVKFDMTRGKAQANKCIQSPKTDTVGVVHKSPRKRPHGSFCQDVVDKVQQLSERVPKLRTNVSPSSKSIPKARHCKAIQLETVQGDVETIKALHRNEAHLSLSQSLPSVVEKPNDVSTAHIVSRTGLQGSPKKSNKRTSIQETKSEDHMVYLPTKRKTKKVKLKHNWTLLSDRSMRQILLEQNEAEKFEGFPSSGGHYDLPTDVSYVEMSEVEVSDDSDVEWIMDEYDVDGSVEFLPRQRVLRARKENTNSDSSICESATENHLDCKGKKASKPPTVKVPAQPESAIMETHHTSGEKLVATTSNVRPSPSAVILATDLRETLSPKFLSKMGAEDNSTVQAQPGSLQDLLQDGYEMLWVGPVPDNKKKEFSPQVSSLSEVKSPPSSIPRRPVMSGPMCSTPVGATKLSKVRRSQAKVNGNTSMDRSSAPNTSMAEGQSPDAFLLNSSHSKRLELSLESSQEAQGIRPESSSGCRNHNPTSMDVNKRTKEGDSLSRQKYKSSLFKRHSLPTFVGPLPLEKLNIRRLSNDSVKLEVGNADKNCEVSPASSTSGKRLLKTDSRTKKTFRMDYIPAFRRGKQGISEQKYSSGAKQLYSPGAENLRRSPRKQNPLKGMPSKLRSSPRKMVRLTGLSPAKRKQASQSPQFPTMATRRSPARKSLLQKYQSPSRHSSPKKLTKVQLSSKQSPTASKQSSGCLATTLSLPSSPKKSVASRKPSPKAKRKMSFRGSSSPHSPDSRNRQLLLSPRSRKRNPIVSISPLTSKVTQSPNNKKRFRRNTLTSPVLSLRQSPRKSTMVSPTLRKMGTISQQVAGMVVENEEGSDPYLYS